MGPLALLGAALAGGIIARAVLSDDKPASRTGGGRAASRDAQPNVAPQSFVVTPVGSGGGSSEASAAQNASIVDAVRKFTV